MQTQEYTFSEELFSDLFKDAYGFHPRSHPFYDDNDAEKRINAEQI